MPFDVARDVVLGYRRAFADVSRIEMGDAHLWSSGCELPDANASSGYVEGCLADVLEGASVFTDATVCRASVPAQLAADVRSVF